jgi:hypothetical protein
MNSWDYATYVRLTVAFRYVSEDTWGLISQLGRQFGLSRSTIYRDLERIEQALGGNRPGRKPDSVSALVGRIEDLEAEQADLEAQVADLEARLSRSVEVTPQRIEDLLLVAVTTPPSYEGIGQYVHAAFGATYRPSPTAIHRIVTRFGTTAGKILTDPRVTDRFEEACCDELFAGRRPILGVVEPASLAIGALERSEDRSGASWQVVLEAFAHLRYVCSDLGRGLCGGIGLSAQILRHNPDFWHLVVRPLSRITRHLEAQLERVWEEERKAVALHARPKGKGKLYRPKLVRIQQETQAYFEQMECYYQGLEALLEAFDPVVDEPGAPHVRTPQEAQARLQQALDRLKTLPDAQVKTLVKRLEAHREELFSFLEQLHSQMEEVPLEGIEDPQMATQIRALVCSEILLSVQRAHTTDPQVIKAYRQIWEEIGRLGALGRYYPSWRKALSGCLYRPRRTSSLSEAVNSPLRTLQQIHRNLSQPLLDLFALRWNMTPFGRGARRQGTSPYQRLGVDLGTHDWLDALRTYRAAS